VAHFHRALLVIEFSSGSGIPVPPPATPLYTGLRPPSTARASAQRGRQTQRTARPEGAGKSGGPSLAASPRLAGALAGWILPYGEEENRQRCTFGVLKNEAQLHST